MQALHGELDGSNILLSFDTLFSPFLYLYGVISYMVT